LRKIRSLSIENNQNDQSPVLWKNQASGPHKVTAIDKFFVVKEAIYEQVVLLTAFRNLGFFVVFIQFLQMNSYLNVF
jgi:hypothetical protein